MIDLKILKDDSARIKAEVKKRGLKVDVDKLVKLDGKRRDSQAKFDELRSKQKGTKDPAAGKKLKTELKKIEAGHRKVQAQFDELYLQLPNFTANDLPVAEDLVEKEAGDKPRFDGAKPHYEIPGIKPLIDFERGAKVAGTRFWFLKGALVDLEFAIIRYALDFYRGKKYLPMRPPTLVNRKAMVGTGFFPAEENEIYLTTDGWLEEMVRRWVAAGKLSPPDVRSYEKKKLSTHYLSGTAEVQLASYHADETLDELPMRYIGFSPAYRREAGSYGKDTKGIFRGHEFDKLELFVFCAPEKSWDAHEELQAQAEEFWSSLKIPFRTVTIAVNELGAPNAKKYDLEAWLPGEGKYREVASNSNDTDFQARRLRIKHGGELVHTLNNTAAAVGRTIIAIVENYQQKDGSINMPEVLKPYLPFERITKTGDTE